MVSPYSTTTLSFSVPTEGVVSLNIYDMTGRLVSTLVDGNLEQGYHSITWNGMDRNAHAVSSGMYIYSLKSEGIHNQENGADEIKVSI